MDTTRIDHECNKQPRVNYLTFFNNIRFTLPIDPDDGKPFPPYVIFSGKVTVLELHYPLLDSPIPISQQYKMEDGKIIGVEFGHAPQDLLSPPDFQCLYELLSRPDRDILVVHTFVLKFLSTAISIGVDYINSLPQDVKPTEELGTYLENLALATYSFSRELDKATRAALQLEEMGISIASISSFRLVAKEAFAIFSPGLDKAGGIFARLFPEKNRELIKTYLSDLS